MGNCGLVNSSVKKVHVYGIMSVAPTVLLLVFNKTRNQNEWLTLIK